MFDGTSLPLISFSKIPTANPFEHDMALKNVVAQSSRKIVRFPSQRSTTNGVASSKVIARSTAKVAATCAREQSVVTAA